MMQLCKCSKFTVLAHSLLTSIEKFDFLFVAAGYDALGNKVWVIIGSHLG